MMDSRDATCGTEKQEWMEEPPTREGFYWLRRKGLDDTVVKTFRLGVAWYVSFPSVAGVTPLDVIRDAKWQGPILPLQTKGATS